MTFAAASRAGGLCLHRTQDGLLGTDHRTTTLTSRTGLCATIALGTTTMTMWTSHIFLQFELLLNTRRNLLQVELDTHTKVGATELALLATATATASEATEASETTTTTEDITKHAEDIIHRHAASEATSERTTVACCTTHTSFAKLVVTLALVRIRKHAIGLCSLLELLLSLFVARITVRMILDGLFLVGFLDLVS